ncbi:hypothetical protein Ae201684P_006784 [Aphanomyces euteiches]|uniref:Uncharacterized protein n=1 Tax=Aphanomyces euteiches TaxID=100861 RepID=A0A6G0W8F7_9STRA|nr:hypothetical protein Ae201684_017649 [Aphanomyces euteiches]KAH9100588.1 hypothetical protein Ae201684P_006784 [Aphanomyces euteiches]KAH9153856.1 hypothetical protein AeRB84_003944 [Aphanomyces euteiches]
MPKVLVVIRQQTLHVCHRIPWRNNLFARRRVLRWGRMRGMSGAESAMSCKLGAVWKLAPSAAAMAKAFPTQMRLRRASFDRAEAEDFPWTMLRAKLSNAAVHLAAVDLAFELAAVFDTEESGVDLVVAVLDRASVPLHVKVAFPRPWCGGKLAAIEEAVHG